MLSFLIYERQIGSPDRGEIYFALHYSSTPKFLGCIILVLLVLVSHFQEYA